MSFWQKLRGLHVEKQLKFRILLLIEGILLIWGMVGLFGKNAVYQYGIEHMTSYFGVYSEEMGGIYTDGAAVEAGDMVTFQNIVLPKGTYQIQLQYKSSADWQNSCTVSDDTISPKLLRTNGVLLFSGLAETDYEMWLLRDTCGMTVHAYYGGTGEFTVSGLTIQQTNAWNRILFCLLLCGISFVNVIYLYVQYNKAYTISVKSKTVFFLLGLTVLFAAMPLWTDYALSGSDLTYHLMRVEGIRDGMLSGQFPIRISPKWQQGYGYASPIFYGETILYLAAALRLIGFSVLTSYRVFMLAVVVATVLIAYFCFRKIFQNAYVGVFCSALYSLSIYRILKTYIMAAWGECFGIMLLPILVYGFFKVFTQDIKQKDYGRSWIPLTIGFTLLIQSHFLTCELVGGFTILLCILLWKKVFQKETFLVLAKTVIYSVLLSAWFLVPFLDYMLTGDFVIHHVSERTIQERGLYPAHLLFTFFRKGGNVFFEENGMANTEPMGVGFVLIVALCCFGYMLFHRKTQGLKATELVLGKICSLFGILAMIMSLSAFPWDTIQFLNGITQTLVSSIQFPHRFLTIGTVCLVTTAGLVAKYVLQHGKQAMKVTFFGGMTFLLGIGSIFLMEDVLDTGNFYRIYNSEGMGTGYISGGEYLPYGAEASAFLYHDPTCSENVFLEGYERKSLGGDASVINIGETKGSVAFSLLYYKGYQAYSPDTGEQLVCRAGNNFEVTVEIPAGFDGMIQVRFESPWYWRVGEVVSLLTLIGLLVSIHYIKRRQGLQSLYQKEGERA